MRWIEAADVLIMAAEVLGDEPEALGDRVDLAALNTALGAVRRSEPRCPEDAAARLFAELSRSAALSAGRLRVAWLAACQLLSLNDRNVVETDAAYLRALLNDVAAGRRAHWELAAWFNGACVPGRRRLDPSRLLAVPAGAMSAHNPINIRKLRRGPMFERFTPESRAVIAEARQEAARLGHNFIGTEHLLLALLVDGRGVAARALASFGVTLEQTRSRVVELIGPGPVPHQIEKSPFTPRTKKVLELSLRHAVRLGDRGIGTEHILLGILDEGEGVAARVLEQMGVGFDDLRERLVSLSAEAPPMAVDDPHLGERLHADLDALIQRNAELESEVERLRGLLVERGIDPGGGELTA